MYSISIIFVSLFVAYAVNAADFYSFTVEDNIGESVSLEKYRGKVTLVVNVASLCGFTDVTYKALTKIHDILSYDGFFSVLAFPCNQFAEQEPEDAQSIAHVMKNEYGIEFPIFNKIDVIGENASPAFRNLIVQSSKEPEWNFYKYLVGPDGIVINAWSTKVELEEIFSEVQEAVNKAKAAVITGGKDLKRESDSETRTTLEEPEMTPKEEL